MKECVFVLPLSTNDGKPLIGLHHQLKKELCKKFGGYTADPVNGGWVDVDGILYEDNSLRYTVAVIKGIDEDNLFTIIERYGRLAEQKCVYVRGTSGYVSFMPIDDISTADLGTFGQEIAA